MSRELPPCDEQLSCWRVKDMYKMMRETLDADASTKMLSNEAAASLTAAAISSLTYGWYEDRENKKAK